MAWKTLLQLSVLIVLFTKEISGNDDMYRCPEHLTRTIYLKTFREKCYRYEKSESYWTTARSRCSGEGGDLVQIRDQATQNWVMSMLNELNWNKNGVWIGAHDRDTEMDWRWVTGDKITWNYWASGQPNCELFCVEDCGNLRRDDGGRWHDKLCNTIEYSYICQYEMKPGTTTTTTTNSTTMLTTTMVPNTTITTTATVYRAGKLVWVIVASVLGAIALLVLLSVLCFRIRKKKTYTDKRKLNSGISKHKRSLNDPVFTGLQNVRTEPYESTECQVELPNVSVISKEFDQYSEILEQKMNDKFNVYLPKCDNDDYEKFDEAITSSENQNEECGNV